MSPFVSFNSACLPSSVIFTLEIHSTEALFVREGGSSLFSLDDKAKLFFHLRGWMGREPEARAPTLYCGDDLVDVVADDTKPDVFGILLYHTA